MKNLKLSLILLLLLGVFFFQSCSDDIEDFDTEYQTEKRQRQIPSDIWLPQEDPCITFWIDPDCCAGGIDINWCNAIDNAMQAYNEIPTPLTFEPAIGPEDADLVINCNDFNNDCRAGTFNPALGDLLQLNSTLSNFECFCGPDTPINFCMLQYVVIHELGHWLGLAHTNENDEPQVHIEGTPLEDENSIFNDGNNSNICDCEDAPEFSNWDIISLQLIYGQGPTNKPEEQTDYCTCECIYEVEDSYSGYSYEQGFSYTIECSEDCTEGYDCRKSDPRYTYSPCE